jgi:exodeoxyribonuclease V alpha subunit
MTTVPRLTEAELSRMLEIPPFRAIDRQFARYLQRCHRADEFAALAGAVTSAILDDGHSCLKFAELCGQLWGEEDGETIHLPDADQWIASLKDSEAVGDPGEKKPLILDDGRLYLYKYFNFEKNVAERIRSMSVVEDVSVPDAVVALARKIFNEEMDLSAWGGQLQAAGAFLPFFSRLSIITGGPGTGKTTVLAGILALLCANAAACGEDFPVIRLAAPTGKAAQRMGESIRAAALNIPDHDIKEHLLRLIPSTIHTLLGLHGDSPKPKRNHETPIDASIVVIDEASMMDITLFARLIDALPDNARLILLGDRYQLASVQAGCVMADICDTLLPNSFSGAFATCVNRAITRKENHITADRSARPLTPVVELQYSYRFKAGMPIAEVSGAVNQGDADRSIASLTAVQREEDSCRLRPYPGEKELAELIVKEYAPLFAATTPEAALKQMEKFMVLTVLNDGRFGRTGINQAVYRAYGSVPRVRPIKITENSPQHKLFNGDMGVIIRTKDDEGTVMERAWFPSVSDGKSASPETADAAAPRPFLVGALPAYVDALAITIHNSQGSEFEKVAIVLPEKDMSILTREILYTSITRAKKIAVLYGTEQIIKDAVAKKITRHSGLAARLQNDP